MRPLQAEYPFIWVDALYEKVRRNNRVVSSAIMIAYGIDLKGQREILAVEPMWEQSEDSWREFMRKPKRRGVSRLRMFISDAHQGIQAEVKKEWLGASWQRYKVHFMRNFLAEIPHRDKARLADQLKQLWLQPDRRSAERLAGLLIGEYEGKYPEAMRCLEEGLEDSLQFYNFPERTSQEIRCRSRLVGDFPSIESYLRLVTAYLIEYTEGWANENAYIKADKLGSLLEQELAQAAN